VKLCLSIEIQEGLSYSATLAMAQAAEALGFDAALLAEHYCPSGPRQLYQQGPGAFDSADAWMYLAAMARETSSLRLGTLVSPVTFRHPSVLAKMAATLDHLSNGRAELGIGAGWLEPEHSAYGIDFPEPGRRVDLVEEQLQVITGLWTQVSFSHDGRSYHLREAQFTPRLIQKPHPPIVLGGRITSQRLPRLAVRYADEFVITQATPDDVRAARTRLDQLCEAAGRDPASLPLSIFVPLCVAPTEAEVEQTLQLYRDTNPQFAGMMGSLAPWIMGTPSQVQERLHALDEAGTARVMIAVNHDLHREMLPLLMAG
jgi:probable F420-dependent oxidoreductase